MQILKQFFALAIILSRDYSIAGSHILFLHTCVSFSHRVSSWPFVEALVNKGHQVTFIGPYSQPIPNPNVTDIIPKRLSTFIHNVIASDFDVTNRASGLTPKFVMVYDYICYEACNQLLQSEEMQKWFDIDPKVDLIYSDTVSECSYGLATKLNSKHGIILPVSILPKYNDAFGLPAETSTVPDWDVSYKPPLTFISRTIGFMIPLIWRFNQIIYYPWYQSLFKTYLGLDKSPTLAEMQANTSLILINGDFIEDYPRSYPPMVIKLPGLHVKERNGIQKKPLIKELEDFINKQDFFYISFGTVAKGPNLPLEIREMFFNVIKSFPNLKFFWRWDGKKPDIYPNNLLLKDWLQQEDLLGHPKIKGFITQSGRPSMMEAFYNGVPTITFPILGDQDFNAHRYELLGISINLDIVGLKEEVLKNAINEMLNNPKYRQKIENLKQFAKDVSPESPIDTAVYWTELILKNDNENLSLLHPTSVYWFQRRNIDVLIFIGILLAILVKLFLAVLKLLITKTRSRAIEKISPDNSRKTKSS